MPASNTTKRETHHGVFMCIDHVGVLITGPAGSGKSSLALELLHQQQRLIADDIVEFQHHQRQVIGYCPPLLKGYLHQREIGLLKVGELFGKDAVVASCVLDVVIRLDPEFQPYASLHAPITHYRVCQQYFPQLTLNPNNPAQLIHRLTSWLTMRQQSIENVFCQQQQSAIRVQKTS